MADRSLAELFALLPEEERVAWLQQLSPTEEEMLLYDWKFWGRPKQQEPEGDWTYWLLLAGRGFGKTRTGAEWIYHRVREGHARHIAFIAPTAADARDVMIEGPAGIMHSGAPWERPEYFPSKRLLVFPNGAKAQTFSGEDPEALRGPQHDTIWADEPAAWQYPQETWDMAMFGFRMGRVPRACLTTTPKPIPLVKELVRNPLCHVTRGTTYENMQNLAEPFAKAIIAKFEGTRLGRQELYAEILDDVPGALWTRGLLEETRVRELPPGDIIRTVVSIDPAATKNENSDATGIVVACLHRNGHGYVLEDATMMATPQEWGTKAVELYHKWGADRIVAETNQGGDMVEYVLRSIAPNIPFYGLRASKGKITRAEPVAALYEQKRCHHVGYFADLETEMCEYAPALVDFSPDRMDALVWAFTELMLEDLPVPELSPIVSEQVSYWRT